MKILRKQVRERSAKFCFSSLTVDRFFEDIGSTELDGLWSDVVRAFGLDEAVSPSVLSKQSTALSFALYNVKDPNSIFCLEANPSATLAVVREAVEECIDGVGRRREHGLLFELRRDQSDRPRANTTYGKIALAMGFEDDDFAPTQELKERFELLIDVCEKAGGYVFNDIHLVINALVSKRADQDPPVESGD